MFRVKELEVLPKKLWRVSAASRAHIMPAALGVCWEERQEVGESGLYTHHKVGRAVASLSCSRSLTMHG